jgi:4-coumarate--CoA ligase
MADKNITRDHIVTLCTHNHMNCVDPYIATQFLGARMASIHPSLSPQEMTHALKQLRPKILFVAPQSAATIEKILQDISLDSEVVVFGTSTKHTEFSHFIRPHEREEEFQPVEVENLKDTAVVYLSSGTSGLSKSICISHYSFVSQYVNFTYTENLDYEYMKQQAKRVCFPLTTLSYTSPYWISAGGLLLTSILSGNCRLVCQNFDAREAWNVIHKYTPVLLYMTPYQIMDMLDEGRPRDVDVKSVLSVIAAGSPFPKVYALKLKEQFPDADLLNGYGLTETCGVLTLFKTNDQLHRLLMQKPEKTYSVGLPLSGVSYKVLPTLVSQNNY